MTDKAAHYVRVQTAIAELEDFVGCPQTLMQKAAFMNKKGPFTVRGQKWSKWALHKFLQRSEAAFGVQPEAAASE